MPAEDAALVSEVLVAGDLRRVDSPGIARLENHVIMLRAGRINPRPAWRVIRETPATAAIDGDNGLGLVIGPKANDARDVRTGMAATALRLEMLVGRPARHIIATAGDPG